MYESSDDDASHESHDGAASSHDMTM